MATCNITFEFILKQSEVFCKIMHSGQWPGWVLIARACFRKIFQFAICSWLIFTGLSPWAAYVHTAATLVNICRVWWGIHHVGDCGSVCTRCMARLLWKIHPKEYSSYQAFWKFCCEFVMLVSVSLTDGARLLHMELQKLPCFLFLIEVLDLSGLCNCFLKQLIHDCQGTSFLTCSDLWCHKLYDPVSSCTEVCKWR